LAQPPVAVDYAAAVGRAGVLARSNRRSILGIVGKPGSGKSTLAGGLIKALGRGAVSVPMDGFHLAQAELARLGRQRRKGAVDTFDVAGYIALLQRLRQREHGVVVYAPSFSREIEEPIAGAIAILPEVSLVVTEGNYLLVGEGPWAGVRPLLDEAWYIEVDEKVRIERLVARHVEFGKTPDEARRWSLSSDRDNAELVANTRVRADLVVRLD